MTLMGRVYSQARNVRTWLGRGDLSGPGRTRLAFAWLRRFLSDSEISVGADDDSSRVERRLTSVDALADLFRNDYWRRRWITQEIVLAKRLSMYCGSSLEHRVDLRDLYSRLSRLATQLQVVLPYHGDREVFNVVDHDKDRWKAHQPINEILNAILPVTAFDQPLTKHPYLLRDIRGAKQGDDRDCVYGIMGLLQRDLGHTLLTPNKTLPVEEVFEDFTFKFMTASASLALLYEAYPEDRALPTWVPDLRVTSRDNTRFVPDTVPMTPEPDSGIQSMSFRTGTRFPDAASQRRTNTLAEFDHLFNASASTPFFAALPATGVLHLHSLNVDVIADCSAHDRGLRDIAPETAMDEWIPLDWTDMYEYATRYGNFAQYDMPDDDVLLRTLCADAIRPPGEAMRRLTPQDVRDHRQGIEVLRQYRGQVVQHPTTFLDASMSLYRFFCTAEGRIGITYGDIEVGDMIHVAWSLNMPLVIRGAKYADEHDLARAAERTLLDESYRGRSLETFELVGSCFLFGVMDGEAVVAAAR